MNARDLALLELDGKRLPGWERDILAQRNLRRTPLPDPRDRALAEQIVVGVVKNLLFLEYLTEHYAKRRVEKIDPLVRKIVAMGLYQLRFLDRVPESAAVNEAVEQTRRFGRTGASGFVNAVLRQAVREPEVKLPTREENARRYAEVVLSHPGELFDRLEKVMGAEAAVKCCIHNNGEPPTVVRLYRGVDEGQLEGTEVTVRAHECAGMFIVEPVRQKVLADWSRRGIAQVQDPTAAKVVGHCDIRPGQVVMDRCAGMGTKTLQMREWVGEEGRVVAIDPAEDRCDALRKTLAERRITNIQVYQAEKVPGKDGALPQAFDRVLVDVPCSNSGVLARRPEARYAQTGQAMKSLGKLQMQILKDSLPWVKVGGLLIYSTCSIWPEENEQLVGEFLGANKDYEKVEEQGTLPSLEAEAEKYHDGGYFAVLRRKSS